jgi:hypothetical protein
VKARETAKNVLAAKVGDDSKKRQDFDQVTYFISWVSSEECKDAVSTKVRVMIMNFEDFVKAGYNTRNEDKGPKTIDQIHEEAKNEAKLNESERIAYEEEQKMQRRDNDRRRGPAVYPGRASLEKKNIQEKRSAAVNASTNVGNSSQLKQNLRSVIKADNDTRLGTTKSSNFFTHNKKPSNEQPEEDDGWIKAKGGVRGPPKDDSGSGPHSRRESQERN